MHPYPTVHQNLTLNFYKTDDGTSVDRGTILPSGESWWGYIEQSVIINGGTGAIIEEEPVFMDWFKNGCLTCMTGQI